ncbi:hypothetical protein QBC47DRAFT_436800 [Echria macrotheca]|uniref:Uncharacterized protein n=1 Tax=Echria macrotheca TaxID=438768 RepID=A0AAJ0BJN6_9PEZI|nr:hypothetical protein QBC47DRAFT_436800 [Echria macrotheca]
MTMLHQPVYIADLESLTSAVLHLLRDAAIDRKCENVVAACIQPDMPFQCFKIPCTKENYWARMLADSAESLVIQFRVTMCT